MDVSSLITSEVVQGALFSESGATSAEKLREVIEAVQTRYYESVLQAQTQSPSQPDDLGFLEDAAFHLVNVVTRKDAAFGEEDWSNALGVAGLVFELLGRVGEASRRRDFLLNAALADSLAGYPSNSTVILRDVIGDVASEAYSVMQQFRERATGLGMDRFVILVMLARGLRALVQESDQVGQILGAQERDLANTFAGDRIHPREYYAAISYLRLAQAGLKTAEYMLTGDEQAEENAAKLAQASLSSAYESKDVEAFWVARLFARARDRMITHSIWRQLVGGVPDDYLRLLATANQPVVELWPSQVKALRPHNDSTVDQDGLLSERYRRIFIAMPTSSGKSLLAELAIVKELFKSDHGRRYCFYVVPTRALVAEVVERLSDRLFDLGVAVKQVASGYDEDPFDFFLLAAVNRSVFVMTQEKLSLLLHQNSELLDDCHLFVFDEVHNISEGARGWTLESALSWLSNIKEDVKDRKMVFISAAVNPSQDFVDWLTRDGQLEHLVLSTTWRPTRQLWGLCDFPKAPMYSLWPLLGDGMGKREWHASGRLTYVDASKVESDFAVHSIKNVIQSRQVVQWDKRQKRNTVDRSMSTSQENHAAQLAAKLAKLGSVLVYFPQVDSLSVFANELGSLADVLPGARVPEELTQFLHQRLHPDYALCRWIGKGIAFHHGRLPLDVRAELERQYRDGAIPVLASTTTLAEGVNLPTRSLVVAGTSFGSWTPDELSIQKFRNMIGRAGRAMKETEGMAVFLEAPLRWAYQGAGNRTWRDYFFPSPEELEPHSFIAGLSQDDHKAFFELLDKVSHWNDLNPVTSEEVTGVSGQSRERVADPARRIQAFLLAMDAHGVLGNAPEELEERLTQLLATTYTGRVIIREDAEAIRRYSAQTTTVARAAMGNATRALVAKTGLSPASSHRLLTLANELWTSMVDWPSDSPAFAEFILQQIFRAHIPEGTPSAIRRGRGNSRIIDIDHARAATSWTYGGMGLKDLADTFFRDIKDVDMRLDRTLRYVEETFEYRLPWIVSALHSLLIAKAEESDDQPDWSDAQFELSIFPALLRFGVDSAAAALFASLGVSSSRAAKFLAKRYLHAVPQGGRDFQRMYRWGMSQSGLDMEIDDSVTALELKRAFAQLSRLQMRTVQLLLGERLTCHIAGWRYYQGERILDELSPGTELELRPDAANEYDSNAVAILLQGRRLGYLPAHLSREIKTELRQRRLRCTVVRVNATAPPWERVEVQVGREVQV